MIKFFSSAIFIPILKNKETSHSSLNQFTCIINDIKEFTDSSNALITLITKDKQSLKSSITRKSLKKLNLKDGETEVKVYIESDDKVIKFKLEEKRKIDYNLLNTLNLEKNTEIT